MPDWVIDKARPSASVRLPEPLRPLVLMVMLPVVAWVVLRWPLRLTVPPVTVTGPATLAAPKVMLPVLVLLPTRQLAAPLARVRLEASKADVKVLPTDSMTTAPEVLMTGLSTPLAGRVTLSD